MPAFHGIISQEYLEVWQKFVEACWLICRPIVHKSDGKKAEELLVEFGKRFESLFGRDAVTPNIHFATHIVECMEEFGSIYTFWCFGMERLNGFLGDYTTNSRCIEVTITRKFLSDCYLASRSHDIPDFLKELFPSFFTKAVSMQVAKPPTLPKKVELLGSLPLSECINLWKETDHIVIKGKPERYLLDADDRDLLMKSYKSMYPSVEINLSDVYEMCFKINTLSLGSHRLFTGSTHESKKCIIKANWSDTNGNITLDLEDFKIGQIKHFLKHCINLDGQRKMHIICVMDWFEEFHHESIDTECIFPTLVFRKSDKIKGGPSSFMPIQRIESICAYSTRTIKGHKNCTLASPVKLNIYVETDCVM